MTRIRPQSQEKERIDRGATAVAAFVRAYWMLGGPTALWFLGVFVARGPSHLTWIDPTYAAVAASIIGARYVDITRLDGRTADGEPATSSHWRRHATTVAVAAAGGWVVARVVALFLAR